MTEDKETTENLEENEVKELSFSDLNLDQEIISVLDAKGYQSPTTVQRLAIPNLLEGKDIIGSAPTGTGKTAAFALPMLCRLKNGSGLRGLILVPTRELAAQCEDNFQTYGQHLNLKITVLYGGVGYNKQVKELENIPDIVIATPGRLIDHYENKRLNFDKLEMLVLDEVDRMLDMGFIDDVRRIIKMCPKKRQTLLFSATVPDTIKKLANWATIDPVTVDAGQRRMPAETIDHSIYPVDAMQKADLLLALLDTIEYQCVIVFTRTKRDADRVAEWLIGHKLSVATMHADRSQSEREKALKGFKDGSYKVLVATDVASRGLDISNISHVINFNVPEQAEDYVHRIGRTGRAEQQGEAMTFYSNDEHSFLAAIERYIDKPIKRKKLDSFDYRREPDMGTTVKASASGFGRGSDPRSMRGRRGRRS